MGREDLVGAELPVLGMEILFDDRADSGIFAINKPAGTDVFQWSFRHTGYPRVWEAIKKQTGGGHAHRIDRWTSGVLMCGLSRPALSYLRSVWTTPDLRKFYLAIVPNSGIWERAERIELEYPIKGALACTDFRVLGRDFSNEFVLLSCELVRFGRTHQIRKHLKILGTPIVGDHVFKGDCSDPRSQSRVELWSGEFNQFLHAWQVHFALPSGEKVVVEAPVPDDFREWKFDWKKIEGGGSLIPKGEEGRELKLEPLGSEDFDLLDWLPGDSRGWIGWSPDD